MIEAHIAKTLQGLDGIIGGRSAAVDWTRVVTPGVARRVIAARMGVTVSRGALYRWLNSGKIVAARVAWKWFIPRSELDRILERMEEGEDF